MGWSIYRLRLYDVLTLCVVWLILLGVVMVESASTGVSNTQTVWGFTATGWKHLLTAMLAVGVFYLSSYIDYRHLLGSERVWWAKPLIWGYALAVVLCALTLIPGIGTSVNGARRWISVGPITLQPSELAKWAVVLLSVWMVCRFAAVRRSFVGFMLACAVIAVPCGLVVMQDFGTAALIGLVAMLILFAGGVRLWYPLVLIPPVLGLAVVAVVSKEYRLKRVTSFLRPMEDPQGEGYHMVQSLLSFSSGGVFGTGLGNGVQKLGYLPEDTTDFIFAVICEELGLCGALLVMVLFFGIGFVAWQVIRDSVRRPDPLSDTTATPGFAPLLAFGVATMVCLQALINMAVATVSVPTKGLPLPLISAGGTGLVTTCLALGMLASVVRQREPVAVSTSASEVSPVSRGATAP